MKEIRNPTNGTSYNIDGTGQVASSTDSNNNTTTYNGSNGTITENGVTVTINKNGNNQITSIIASTGQEVDYSYDGNGNLVTVIQPQDQGSGHVTFTYKYDSNHYL